MAVTSLASSPYVRAAVCLPDGIVIHDMGPRGMNLDEGREQ